MIYPACPLPPPPTTQRITECYGITMFWRHVFVRYNSLDERPIKTRQKIYDTQYYAGNGKWITDNTVSFRNNTIDLRNA